MNNQRVGLLNINARSITNKTEHLEAILLAHDPHLVVLTETWLHTFVSDDDVVPPGFKIFRKGRATRGGGVAVILKDCIKATLLSDVPDLECLCLNVTLGCQNFVLYAAYRAPDATSDYLTKLHAHMLQFNERKVILAGDFNLPGIDWERLEAGSDSVNISCMFDIMIDHNLVQVVVKPTRVTESTSSLLDLVFLHRSIAQCDVSLIPGISDHSLISVSFPLNMNRSGGVNTTKAVKNFAHAQDSGIF